MPPMPSQPPHPPSPRPAAPSAAPAPLDIEVAPENGAVCVSLVGELTYATVVLFTERVTEVLAAPGPLLVLDVARLHFCDSIGLSALIGAQQRARRCGGDVVLTGLCGSLARQLAVTGAGLLFGVVDAPENPECSGFSGEPA